MHQSLNKHTLGVEYARTLFSRGDIWGNGIRIYHTVGFDKRRIVGIQSSFSMLQKQRVSSDGYYGSGLQAAYYSADIGLKLNARIWRTNWSAMGGYAMMWGNEIVSGNAVGVVGTGQARYFLVEPVFGSSVFTNQIYKGTVLQAQVDILLSKHLSLGLTGRGLLVYRKEITNLAFAPSNINNSVFSAGGSVQYSF